MGFNVDGKGPAELTVGAVGAELGSGDRRPGGARRRSPGTRHIGDARGVDGVGGGGARRLVRQDSPSGREGTANVGVFGGRDGKSAGEATNVVTDYVYLRGESRSHDPSFVKEIVAAWRTAFTHAAAQVKDDKGRARKLKFTSKLDYHSFRLKDNAPVVRRAMRAAESIGLTPTLKVGNGGLDANWLVRHRIPTVTFGAGQHNIHTTEEYVDVKMYLDGCRMALALAVSQE